MDNETCIQKFVAAYTHRLSDFTLYIYPKAIRSLLEFSQKAFHEVTSRDIRQWIQESQRKYKPNSVNVRIGAIRMFYRFCSEDALIKQDPTASINYIAIPESPTYYLQMDQLTQLRKVVEHDLQKRALIEVLYATGMRLSEALAMKLEDINWTDRFIHIPNGKRKKARIVCFTNTCATFLQEYLNARESDLPYVFLNSSRTGPAIKRTINYQFDRYSEQLGFRVTPHVLRHTFAAHLAKKGMPLNGIQTLLGHEFPHQTQVYARLYADARKEIYDQWM